MTTPTQTNSEAQQARAMMELAQARTTAHIKVLKETVASQADEIIVLKIDKTVNEEINVKLQERLREAQQAALKLQGDWKADHDAQATRIQELLAKIEAMEADRVPVTADSPEPTSRRTRQQRRAAPASSKGFDSTEGAGS